MAKRSLLSECSSYMYVVLDCDRVYWK